MSSYEKRRDEMLKKYGVVNKEEKTNEKSKSTSSAKSSYEKRRDEMLAKYSPTVTIDLDYINSFVNDVGKYMNSIETDYNGMGSSNSGSVYDQRKSATYDLRARSAAISKYLDSNKGNIDTDTYNSLKSYINSFDSASGNALYNFYKANNYYSQWESDEHYFKDAEDAREDRLKWYEEQTAKVAALEKELKTATDNRKKEITAEIDSINAEIRLYKSGENGWTSKYLDDTYGITENEDFESGSANRTFENPSRENLDLFTAMMDTSQWYWDADGNRYDALGNLVYKAGEAQTDERNVVIHPLANDERFAVQDRYGMWKNATEEERREASAVREWSDGYDTWSNAVLAGDEYFWDRLTEKEVSIYYYLLNTQGSDAASAFLDNMEVELAQRETGVNNQEWTERYEEASLLGKVFMNAASVPASVFGGALAWIDDSARELRGEEINPYNGSHSLMHYSNTVRGLTAEDLDETGFKLPVIGFSLGDIYQVGMSRLDSALSTAMFGGIGTVFLGTGAAANEAYRLYQKGASEEQITLGAFAAGAAETVFEYLSFDKLIKMKDAKTAGQWVKSALIQGGIEASEEGFTEASNIITNAFIMRDESDWAKLIEDNGSIKGAFQDATMQTIKSMFGGFLGGVGAGLTQGGKSYIANQAKVTDTGRTIMSADGGVDALKTLADEVAGVSNDKTKKALTKQAGKVSGDIATGKNIVGKAAAAVKNTVNANKTGRLYGAVQDANNLANAPKNKADIVKSLERNGVYSETAEDIADALVAKYNGQDLTRAQEKLLEAVENDKDVQDAIRGIVNNQQSTMGQRSKNIRDFNSDVEVGVKAEVVSKVTGVSLDVAKEYVKGNQNAIKESFAESRYEVSADGKTIDKDGNIINVIGIESVKDGKIMLKTENGTIDASEVSFATEDEAFVYSALSNMDVSAESAWALVKGFNKADGVSARLYAIDIPLAYKYGKLNYKAGLQNLSLTPSQSATAFQMGRSDAAVEATEQASTEGTLSEKNADKKIIFEGFTYNEKTAKENQKASMAAIDMISKMSNLEIHVYKSYKKKGNYYAMVNGKERLAPNGYFADGNKVYIDINAGNQGEGLMLYTLSHEIGHYIAKWNAQDFKAISDFLFEHYGENVPIYDLLEAQKNKLKKSYKADGKQIPGEAQLEKEAHEELVCDMLSRMLADKNAYNKLMELKQQDLKAFQKLGQAIKNALEKLAKALGIYDTLNPDFLYAASKENIGEEAFRQLQDLYIKAFVQADANFLSAEKNTTEDGGVKYSLDYNDAIDQLDEGTLDRTKNTHLKVLDSTPQVYIDKAGAKNLKIIMGWDIAYLAMNKSGDILGNYHGLGPDVMKAIPQALQDPIYIIKQNNGRIVAVTEVVVKGNRSTLVSVELNAFKSTTQDGENESENYNLIVTIFDAKANYLQNLMSGGEIVHNKNNEDPAHFILRLKSLNKALPDDDRAKSSSENISQDKAKVKSESAEALDVEVDEKTESVAPAILKSERTWTESDYVQEREQAAKEIAKAIGVTEKKAKDYIDSINSIAKMIAEDRVRLDYFSSPGRSSFVGNVEYGGSFDFSTLCKKRRLLTGTFTAIQKALPNTALTADEILDIRNRMKEAGLEVSCGLCYVEGSRANMGQFAKEFLRLYKQYYPDAWQPNMADVNTPDGIEWVRINHPECYEQYEYFWNHYGTLKDGDKNLFASQQKPKLYQLHTEYKGEILEKFNNDDNVEEKNLNGGIRLQSFSDFEIVHLIDTMQIIMDMSRVGLAGQAYTKVPDFAWALGDTGLKINLSLIAKGVDENGKLIFDDVEGMPIAEAMKLRDRYSQNVGTILVAFNDEQLLAAMADDRVDFIIPFHRSQWKKSQYEAMGLPAKTKDYTYMQNEKFIKPQYHEYRGRMVQDKATNYMPNEYWDFSKSGKENAEAYLEMCSRNNKRPKFYKLLQNNGDGSYSLKADGSTDGYWKLLIDFKMYDNDGNGSPQMPVKPDFNMDEAQRMLNDYQGGHSNFPVAQGIVDEFVQEYKDSHEGIRYSDRDSDGNNLSKAQQEFFKGSKVRDANGNLLIVYHGTTANFNIFKKGDVGFHFGTKGAARGRVGYGKNVNIKAVYLNITNPIVFDEDLGSWDADYRLTKELYDRGLLTMNEAMAVLRTDDGRYKRSTEAANKKLADVLIAKGYDGIAYRNTFETKKATTSYIAFSSNQAKETSNLSPTTNPDIRYQDRADESVSNRSLLANAFEGLAQNEIERNKIQEYKGKFDLINAEEKKLSELNEKIRELSFSKGPRDTKKIRELQFEARQTANRINTYDKQLLRLEASKPLQDVLAREKQKAYKKAEQRGKEALAEYKAKVEAQQKETTDKWRESRKAAVAKARETAEKRDARAKLQKLVLDTVNWITYPAKTDVKCPDILKKPYADFLNGIDLSSKRLANGGDATKNDLRLSNAMDSLATALDKIMTAQDPGQDPKKADSNVLDTGYLDLPADFVKELRDVAENIKSMMVEGDYVVNSMTAAEVRQLSQMIRTLNHAIKTMSKLYANLRFANVEALGFDTMEFMDALGEIEKTGGMKDFVQWDNALPYYAFKRFGKGGESVFEGLMDAQDKLAFLAQKIFDFQEKAWTGKEAKEWSEDTHTITLPNGNELTLTTADAMSIYCLSRREQGLQHLLGGGTRVLGIQKGSKKAKDSRSVLTIKDVDAIISTLTDRQKQVAEGIQEFMSTVCAEWGNEISMKRFLTRDFSEKFYFPIESNDENLSTKDPAAQQSDLFRLLNISATKPLTPGANNEVIIRNVFDVFTGHASDMARLNAYGMALLDYMKWLNYREKTVTDEGQINVKGVRKSMEKAYGNAAKSYVLNLVKDVNGRFSDGGDPNILMKWMRAAKTASVGNSLRVATLQITSYPRAALVLSPKSLTLGLSKLPQIDKAKKYCGIALWKSFGFYDTNISRSIEDQMKGVTDVKQKLIELSLKGAEWGDAITWGALWNACEYEVAKTTKNKVGSEEFNQEVGKKLREVVYRTQVVDSMLTRSQIMRSKSGMAQEAAAFMSEPTLSANILMDAGFEFTAEKRRTGSAKAAWNKTGKYIGRAVAVYAIGQLTAALLEGLWDAWRDEEDEEFSKKYLDEFVENLVLDIAPFNKIPIISDLFEAVLSLFDVGFYSSDKMTTTWITQAVSAVDAWKDALGDESSVTFYNALYKTTRAISSFFGVSVSGVMREGVALWNNTAGAYDLTLKILTYDRTEEELGELLLDAFLEGNDRQAESLKAEFEGEDDYTKAVRKAVKNRYEAGDIDDDTAKQYLVEFGGMEEHKAYWRVEEWKYEAETEEEFSQYNDFYTAVETGKDLKTVIKRYTDNGVDKKTLASQITFYFKPLYKEMSKTERATIKGYLLNAYSLLGYNRNEKSKDIDNWLKD